VSQAVDAESGLLDEEDSEDTGIDEATSPVVPAKTADQRGNNQSHGEDALDVVLVLEDNNGIVVEIGDVGTADSPGVLLHNHPSDVAVEETLTNGIGVLLGVGVTVVSAVIPGPPSCATLDSGSASSRKEDLEREGGLVASVSPKTMVAGSC